MIPLRIKNLKNMDNKMEAQKNPRPKKDGKLISKLESKDLRSRSFRKDHHYQRSSSRSIRKDHFL